MDAPSPFGSTLVVTGPEALLAQREVSDFVAAARRQRPDAAVTRLGAGELTPGSLVEVTGGSLLADASIVVVNDLPELPADVADKLVEIATRPGPDLA
ncbi:MAG: DNA polymerase III subunit delta, partial [Propionicimonas sp.]